MYAIVFNSIEGNSTISRMIMSVLKPSYCLVELESSCVVANFLCCLMTQWQFHGFLNFMLCQVRSFTVCRFTKRHTSVSYFIRQTKMFGEARSLSAGRLVYHQIFLKKQKNNNYIFLFPELF